MVEQGLLEVERQVGRRLLQRGRRGVWRSCSDVARNLAPKLTNLTYTTAITPNRRCRMCTCGMAPTHTWAATWRSCSSRWPT